MKPVLFSIAFVLCLTIRAQLDSAGYYARVGFLERKLTYTYFNPDQKTWYVNRFDFDYDKQVVHFKSSSSKNPMKVIGKKYTNRIFRFEDLNPYKITMESVDQNRGLIVAGDLIRLETVKHEKLIRKTINGMSGTPQSYIHFSIPRYMMDSAADYSQNIATALQEVIQFATDLRNSYDNERNATIIFQSMVGEHVSQGLKRFTEYYAEYLLAYEEYVDRKKIRNGLIGFDPVKGRFYEILIEENGEMTTNYYRVDMNDPGLILVDVEGGGTNRIEFINRSKILYLRDGISTEYRPSGSF